MFLLWKAGSAKIRRACGLPHSLGAIQPLLSSGPLRIAPILWLNLWKFCICIYALGDRAFFLHRYSSNIQWILPQRNSRDMVLYPSRPSPIPSKAGFPSLPYEGLFQFLLSHNEFPSTLIEAWNPTAGDIKCVDLFCQHIFLQRSFTPKSSACSGMPVSWSG